MTNAARAQARARAVDHVLTRVLEELGGAVRGGITGLDRERLRSLIGAALDAGYKGVSLLLGECPGCRTKAPFRAFALHLPLDAATRAVTDDRAVLYAVCSACEAHAGDPSWVRRVGAYAESTLRSGDHR